MVDSALKDLTKLSVMPELPKTRAFMQPKPTPSGMIGPAEYGPVLSELRDAETQAAMKVGESDIAIEEAKRQEKAFEAEKRAEFAGKKATEARDLPEQKALTDFSNEYGNMAFVPTKETTQDLAGLFSLIGIVGMVVGKGNSQLAMSSMNGMLEGYQKGRADLYKKELTQFDKNFKAMQSKLTILKEELSRAMELKKLDWEKGDLEVTMALVKADSPVLNAIRKKQGDVAVQNGVQNLIKDMDSAANMNNDIQGKADARADAAAARAQQERIAKENRLASDERARLAREQALALANAKAQTKQEGKALTSKQAQEIEGLDSIQKGLSQLQKDFKPEFAGLGIFGFGADMEFEARRRLGDKKAQEAISWWSRYERFQAPNRHALFGATLTSNELKNYQSFTAKKSDSAETLKTFLQDQLNYSSSVGENKKLNYEGAGYKVPDRQPREFIKSFSTEPSKYSVGQEITQGNKKYRVIDVSNPDDPEVEEIK